MRLARRAPLLTALLALALLAILSRFAFFRMFSQFAPYDDEGYVAQTIRSYIAGAPLYNAVFSQYGPAFYLYGWLLHGLLRVPLTDDAVRFVTIGWWLVGTAIGAAIVFRLTRSVIVTAFGLIVIFVHLRTLINEPGHPQAVLAIAVLLCCLIASRMDESNAVSRTAVLGALGAFAVLGKINVGAFLCLALLLSFVLASPLPAIVRALAAAAGMVIPFVILRVHLASFALPYAIAVSTGVLTVSMAGFRRLRASLPTLRPLLTFCASGAIAAVVLLLPALTGGTTMAALVRATITEPQRLGSVFLVPAFLPRYTYAVGGLSAAICAAFTLSSRVRHSPVAQWFVAIVKLAAIWVLVTDTVYAPFFVFFTPLLWLAPVIPSDRGAEAAPSVLLQRTTIAVVAAFETLQAYPVAGSQLAFATDISVILAIAGIDDALRFMTAGSRTSLRLALRFAVIVAALQVGRPAFAFGILESRYLAGYEVRLPGTTHLRLPPRDVESFHWLTATASTHCDRLLTFPGLYSFNGWSGVPPPTDTNVTAWHILLPVSEQAQIWSALDASPRPCVIVRPAMASGWAGGRPLDQLDAGRHLTGRRLLADSGDFQFMTGTDRGSDEAPVGLMMGRQSFGPGRTPVPIAARVARPGQRFTLRLWFRTAHPGVVFSCQNGNNIDEAVPMVPIVYVDGQGGLRSAELTTDASAAHVADGRWHYVAIVHDGDTRQLFVDDRPAVSASGPHRDDPSPTACQVGNGFLRGWPGAQFGWMPFSGDVAAFGVAAQPWTAAQVAADRQRTHID